MTSEAEPEAFSRDLNESKDGVERRKRVCVTIRERHINYKTTSIVTETL